MTILYQYRVWCETESGHVSTSGYQASAPTECPNDAGHTIDANKTSIVDSNLSLENHVDDDTNPHGVTVIQTGGSSTGGVGAVLLKDESSPFVKNSSSSYEIICSFSFAGTLQGGTPSVCKVVVMATDDSFQGNLRLYDNTNSNVVAESIGITFASEYHSYVKELTIDSEELPSGEAVFELQGKKSSGSGEMRLQSFVFQF